jgi:hypothetical protein
MARIYRGTDTLLGRPVAVKILWAQYADDASFVTRFRREAQAAARLNHPNLVRVYDTGSDDGVHYIVMEHVDAKTVADLLSGDGRIMPDRAVELAKAVCDALAVAHAHGVIHRDVKPANVLLDETAADDHAYITDFGVARNIATESGLTQTGRFVGTLDYVAPEQISGGAVDARTDVYALGCLLYKLLTGEVPYPREGEAARLYAHLNDPPPAPSLRATAVPMALDDVVIRSLSKRPEDRYPSAGDLGRAAVAALSGAAPELPERTVATGAAATGTAETIAPQPSDAATRRLPPERGRGRRPLVALAGLAAVVAAAAAVLLTAGGDDGSPSAGDGGATTVARSEGEGEAVGRQQPSTLTRAELIAEADAICRQSKDRYLEVRDLESERSADPSYAEALVRNARLRVRGLQRLTPPRQLAIPYGEYVEAQERVYATDREALAAAREGSGAGVEAARDRRDAEDRLRRRLAREIGFSVCSTPQR